MFELRAVRDGLGKQGSFLFFVCNSESVLTPARGRVRRSDTSPYRIAVTTDMPPASRESCRAASWMRWLNMKRCAGFELAHDAIRSGGVGAHCGSGRAYVWIPRTFANTVFRDPVRLLSHRV